MRRLLYLAALSGLAAPAACADDFDGGPGPLTDAGSDTALIGETSPPDPDPEVPVGDVCGDRTGLETSSAWPMLGGCPKRAGASERAGPQSATIRWSLPVSAAESSPAITSDGKLWVGTAGGELVAVSGYYGNALGALSIGGGAVRSSPAIEAGGLAVFGGGDGFVYGVAPGASVASDAGGDAGDGGDDAGAALPPARAAWKIPVGGPVASSPAVTRDGAIVVATSTGNLVAVTAGGTTKWTAATGGTSGSSPAIGKDGRIYVGGGSKLYALDPGSGARAWEYDVGAVAGSPAIGGDDTIYVGASDGTVHAITALGKRRWVYRAGGPITGSPAVLGGALYAGSADKKLHAVFVTDGKPRWQYATLGEVASPVIASDGTVYFGSSDGTLYAVRPSGLLFFAVAVKGKVKSAPAIGDDGTLYVTTDTGIVAIGP